MQNAKLALQLRCIRSRQHASYRFVKLLAILAPTLSACGFSASNGVVDASPDGPSDGDAAQLQYGTFIAVKFNSTANIPKDPQTFSDTDAIDTDQSPLCDSHNDQSSTYCVVVGSRISISTTKTLRGTGSKPLIFLSTSEFDLEGGIDVSSVRNGATGAGTAQVAACAGNTDAKMHSGGYGGSFAGQGGAGEAVTGGGEVGGVAAGGMSTFPSTLRGGCPGGTGAAEAGTGNAAGGAGGGAVLIIASTIKFNGKINASGAAGTGGQTAQNKSSGGGGGGAGGMIVLDAATVTAGASSDLWLYANGGGGGQGGTGMGNGTGPGDSGGESLQPAVPAVGGNNTSRSGGSGGTGSAGASQTAGSAGGNSAASNSGGGGGGGGAAGFIRTPPITGAMFAPAPTAP